MRTVSDAPGRATYPGPREGRNTVFSALGPGRAALLAALIIILVAAKALPLPHLFDNPAAYLPLHTAMGIFAIVVSMLVFAAGWHARGRDSAGSIVLIACAFLAVGLLDIAHILSYPGMPDFVTPNSPDKAIHFWLAARGVAGGALLTVAYLPWRPFASSRTRGWMLVAALGVTALVYGLVLFHPDTLPHAFIPGEGPTLFTIGAGYALVAVYALASGIFVIRLRSAPAPHWRDLFAACCVIALSELFFMFQRNLPDTYTLLGDVYRVAGYALIYRALLVQRAEELCRERPSSHVHEAETRLAGERLRLALEGSNLVLVDADVANGKTYLSAAWAAMLGNEPADTVTNFEGLMKLTHPAESERIRQHYYDALTGRVPVYDLEHRVMTRSGAWKWIRSHGRVVARDSNGRVTRIAGTNTDITKRKRAEQALRASEAEMRLVTDHVPVMIAHYDENLRCRYANKRYMDFFDLEIADILGHPLSEIVGKENYSEIKDHFALALSGCPVTYQRIWQLAGGLSRHMETRLVPRAENQGKASGCYVLTIDITERQQAEAARAQLAAIVESSHDAIISRTLDGTITSWNAGAERMLGYSASEAIGRPIAFTLPPERAANIARHTEHILRGAMVAPHETQRTTKDGRVIDVLSSVSPLRNETGEVTGASVILHDISALKQAEAARRESEERFHAAFEQAGVGMALRAIDPHNPRWLRVNQKLCDILGYTRDELLQQTFFDVSLPEDREAAIDLNMQLLRGTISSYSREKRYLRKDGQIIWVNITASAVSGPDVRPNHVISVIEDITAQKHAEERILNLNAELEQRVTERTRQLEATNRELETFSYSVSHDLQAPLRGIDGFSKILLEEYGDRLDTKGSDYLQRIRRATKRMGELIDDMLQLSRVSRHQLAPEAVDLSQLASSILAELGEREPERAVATEIQAGIAVQGDPRLLRILLENLLGNAWKFTRKEPRPRIRFGTTEQDGKTVIWVGDNGAGFAMEYAHKLFGAFQRLHGATEFEGTGIGLATVQRIVALHGGRVWAEGAVGKGAIFYFTF